jgi:hypothetical protein
MLSISGFQPVAKLVDHLVPATGYFQEKTTIGIIKARYSRLARE